MSEEIVITYKTETLRKEDFTEREKAIYRAGYNEAYYSVKNKQGLQWAMIVSFFIFIIIYIFF